MSDRGDYRALYSSFWDDPDVHALSDAAYRVLTTLKGTLPASGIGVVYFGVLAERCKKTPGELEHSLKELEAAKPGANLGWIVRERNIIWVVNGLRYEPTLTSANSKHRTFLRERLLAPLGERTAIVAAFRRYYAEWFKDAVPSSSKPHKSGTKDDRSSGGHRNPTDRESKHNSNSSSNSNSNSYPGLKEESFVARDDFESAVAPIEPHQLAIWANSAVTERWGEQPSPYTPTGAATELSDGIVALGLSGADDNDREVARLSFYRQCRALKGQRPPRTIKYFLGGIEDDWHAEIARRELAASGERPPERRATQPPHARKLTAGEESFANGLAAFADLEEKAS